MRSHYISEVGEHMHGQKVKLAGWVHEIRDLGGLKFIILRDRSGLIQVTVKKSECSEVMLETVNRLIKETAIICEGFVQKSKIASIGKEIIPESIVVVGAVLKTVPFEVTGKVPADIDVRLDNRFIDLRRVETTALFQVRSELQRSFREKLMELGFQEINPPTIVGSSTEGGSEVFQLDYFERKAYLAQSPQLYKQLAIIGGMDKVFMTVPVFRAEKHNTTSHLNEVTQMDAEMGFAEAKDAVELLEEVFLHILKNVKNNCPLQLEKLNSSVNLTSSIPIFSYDEVVNTLNSEGYPMSWGEDLTKDAEKELEKLLKAEVFFIVDWPTRIRAFYSMPYPDRSEVCKSYDLMYRGVEIASGAQRIHLPDLLIKQLEAKGMNPENFESYIDAFRYGAIPHAGWSIGCERLLMKLGNRENIRECALFPRDRHRLTP